MLARCVRIASTTPRFNTTHSRAFVTESQQDAIPRINNIIDAIGPSKFETPSSPPVGTNYPPPRRPDSHNPLQDSVIQKYTEKREKYSLYCQSTRNNTITTLVDDKSHPVAFHSGGTCGFKHVQRSSYEAGYQCAVRMFETILKLRNEKRFDIALYFKGFGQGRDAMHKALLTSEGDRIRELVVSITDRTPIKIGGTRSKKARRL